MKYATANVVPLRRLPHTLDAFTYRIPEDLKKRVKRGVVVRMPFKQQQITGVVISCDQASVVSKGLKSIASMTDVSLTTEQLSIADTLASMYGESLAVILHSFLSPPPART